MSLPSEQRALLFIGAIAVLGAGVRVVRAAGGDRAPVEQPALEHQVRGADSSARAAHAPRQGGGRGRRRGGRSPLDTMHRVDTTRRVPPRTLAPLDRHGYVGSRLDLDVASAAQIDSLPGVLPGMAKRIVADRAARGPFLTIEGLRRVSGVGPRFIGRIDSLVTFSGTIVQPNAVDTVIPRAKRSRGKGSSQARTITLTLPCLRCTMPLVNSARVACPDRTNRTAPHIRGGGVRSSA